MHINLIEQSATDPNQIGTTNLNLSSKPQSVSELLKVLVEYELESNHKFNNFVVNDKTHLTNLIKIGKVGGSIDPRKYRKPDLNEQLEKVLISFKHQDFFLFVDNIEIENLDQELVLNDQSEVVIVANIRFR